MNRFKTIITNGNKSIPIRNASLISIILLICLLTIKGTFFYISFFLIGIISCLSVLTYYTLLYQVPKSTKTPTKYHFQFLNKDQWLKEVANLSVDQEQLNSPIFEESFLISETLDEFINLILKEFIDSWYGKIIKSPSFQGSIRLELKNVFKQLQVRIAQLDIGKLLVSKIIPIMNDHFIDYIKAEERVQTKISTTKTKDQINHDIDVARQYRRGKIHPGVSITKTEVNDMNEKTYLRQSIGSILPYLLSDKENTNEIGLTLVREILACTVLTNIFQLLGEGDFYNLLIVKLIGDNLKRRDQVKKLRAALDEHTQHKDKVDSPLKDNNVNKDYIITENMDIIEYNECLEKINRITSINELKQLRVYLSLQLLTPHEYEGFVARVKEVQILVEHNIKDLEEKSKITLIDVLHNPSYLKEFKTFLKNNRNLNILDFWLAVDNLKAPLELDNDKLSLSLGFSNSEEIKLIHDKYLITLGFSDDLSKIQEYINCEDLIEKANLYKVVRDELFALQQEALGHLHNEFKEFINTNEYNELIRQSAQAQAQQIKSPINDISPIVIQAVEDAFTQIMKNNDNAINKPYESDKQLSTIDLKKDLFGGDSDIFNENRYSKLFDDYSDESGTDSDSIIFDSDSNLRGSLELDNESPTASRNDEDSGQQSLVLAAPGNLKLTEEIRKLTDDIDRLTEQQNILIPLMKKAELTNNLSELKILKNSKISLEREINIKELQKQQYIVQESDNSLYGKSTVKIQSYISGRENGKEFILYIIEVQRYSNENPNTNTAGWIIARRYSQFYKLHEYLKARYSGVSNLKFPKRTMFKLQERQIVELRRTMLEEYVQQLIKIPEVCSNKVFRSFLSSENFDLGSSKDTEDPKKNNESLTNMLYQGISGKSKVKPKDSTTNIETNLNLKEMEKELKSFDEKEIFIKPIIDILVTIFKLKSSKNWIRGRALIVILQQIFGTTIEKKIYDQINQLLQEEKILDILILLKNIVFPNGKFKDPPIIRSTYEKSTTREESGVLLNIFMKDTFNTIFGVSNTRYANGLIFNMLQNDFLIKSLLFEVFDELVVELFPETRPEPR